jgi:predicted GIY-YIG superfamily endonuclease
LPHGAAQKIIDVAFSMFPEDREEEIIDLPSKYRGGGKTSLSASRDVIDLAEEEDDDGVYVLELEGKRFYVGKSHCKRQRILEHKSKRGAVFTRKHAVVNDDSPRLSTPRSLTLAAERLETLQHMVRAEGRQCIRIYMLLENHN